MNETLTPNPPPLRKSLVALALWIFFAVLFVLVIVTVGKYFDFKKKSHLKSETPAEVIRSSGYSARNTGGKSVSSTTVHYRYVVNGQEFSETSVKPAGDTSSSYPIGKNTAKACYDPQKPEDSEVYPLGHVCGEISLNLLPIIGGAVIFMCLCFFIGSAIILIYRAYRYRRISYS